MNCDCPICKAAIDLSVSQYEICYACAPNYEENWEGIGYHKRVIICHKCHTYISVCGKCKNVQVIPDSKFVDIKGVVKENLNKLGFSELK